MTSAIEKIEKAGRRASGLLSSLTRSIRAGQRTRDVAAAALPLAARAGLAPATHDDAPWLSINLGDEACHAPPGDRIIRAGDLATIDIAVRTDDDDPVFIDVARTLVVGRDPRPHPRPDSHPNHYPHTYLRRARHAAATNAVNRAVVAALAPGGRWSDAAQAGHATAARLGFSLASGFPGHGIGAALHQPPIAGYHREEDFEIAPGLVFTVEPILVQDHADGLVTLGDGWTVVTATGGDAAFAEWTIVIGPCGPRVIAS